MIDAAAGASFSSLILLTPPDKVHTSIVEYTTRPYYPPNNLGRIDSLMQDVLGGNTVLPNAITNAVGIQLISLIDNLDQYGNSPYRENSNSPRRFDGMNRFETSALLAVSDAYVLEIENCKHLLGVALTAEVRKDLQDPSCTVRTRGGSYCGREEATAVLVAGDSEIFADLIPAGPFSYAMGVPVLLTSTHGLPEETAKVLSGDFARKVESQPRDSGIYPREIYTRDPNPSDSTYARQPFEHVVIIGGPYSIPDIDALEDQVRAHGIKTVTRLVGATPAETSVVLANELERCLPATPDEAPAFDLGSVALISETALADGISMGVILGVGLQSTFRHPGWTTPALLVGDTLPTAVRDYLREKEVPVKIWAIGGEAAVSSDVVDAAVAAASYES